MVDGDLHWDGAVHGDQHGFLHVVLEAPREEGVGWRLFGGQRGRCGWWCLRCDLGRLPRCPERR